MRCIEINAIDKGLEDLNKININMRCIEIKGKNIIGNMEID